MSAAVAPASGSARTAADGAAAPVAGRPAPQRDAVPAAAARACSGWRLLRRADASPCSRRRCRPGRPARRSASTSRPSGWRTTPTRSTSTCGSSSARSSTPASRPSLALAIGYPLAYAIAFKAGRWKNLLLVAGDRAVLHQLPAAHHRLEADPRRRRAGSSTSLQARCTCCSAASGHIINTRAGRGHRHHLQLPAVHDPADLRLPRTDRPRGCIEAAATCTPTSLTDVAQGHLPAVAARRGRRHAAHVHPGGRRLRQRRAARQPRTRR